MKRKIMIIIIQTFSRYTIEIKRPLRYHLHTLWLHIKCQRLAFYLQDLTQAKVYTKTVVTLASHTFHSRPSSYALCLPVCLRIANFFPPVPNPIHCLPVCLRTKVLDIFLLGLSPPRQCFHRLIPLYTCFPSWMPPLS